MNETELKQIADNLKQMDYAAAEAMKEGNIPKAIAGYELMYDAELAVGLERNAGRTLLNLSNLYLEMNRKEKALERAEKAIESFKRCGAKDDVISGRLIVARCLALLEKKNESIAEVEEAIRSCRTDNQRGDAYLMLAECQRIAGDRWKARDAVDRSVRYFEYLHDDIGLVRALNERIFLMEQSGQAGAAAMDRSRLAVITSSL
ncbi:MAG: hypothetical protein J5643_00245 [Lachnospiraceae bacterium]|nr:hypothetical protein [Lachnospiraceae bacterium]